MVDERMADVEEQGMEERLNTIVRIDGGLC